MASETGSIGAREAVVALGPWSDDAARPLGYDIPLAMKRGYHMHYGVREMPRSVIPCVMPMAALRWRR